MVQPLNNSLPDEGWMTTMQYLIKLLDSSPSRLCFPSTKVETGGSIPACTFAAWGKTGQSHKNFNFEVTLF